MKDFTEEEIMARLDAILPGGEGPSAFTEAPVMTVTETEPAEIPHEAEIPASEEPDPFLRMQAELTAELGTLSTALALEPAPVFDAPPQADPVVEPPVMPPSVLETLPPIEEAPIVPAPAQPGAAVEPGQLVNFDARRSRRKKRGKQGDRERAATPAQPQAAPVAPSRVTPIAESTRPAEAARAGAFSLPRGTQAEAELSGKTRKPVPVWIWAGLILVGLVVAYLTVSRTSDPKAEAASGSGERADAPSETASRSDLLLNSVEALPAQGSPAPAAAPSTPKPVAAPPATDKTADALPPTGSADAPVQEKASPRTRQATASSIRNWQPSSPATEVPQAPPSAPPGADEGVAGVEAVLDTPIPEAPAAVAAGTLVDAAELDTAPVSLSRKLPVYSMQARQLRIQGTVIMKVLVNERGTVDDVVLVEGVPGADLNSSALKSAKSWTYRPATKSGVPVKVWKVEQVTFKM
jgi:protein TonB